MGKTALEVISRKSMDWLGVSSKLSSEAAKKELFALRSAHSELFDKLSSVPDAPKDIDWEYWSTTIKTPGVVDGYKAAYSKIKFDALENPHIKEFDSSLGEMMKLAKAEEADADARIGELEAQLEALLTAVPTEDLTTADFLASNPAIKEEIDKELEEH